MVKDIVEKLICQIYLKKTVTWDMGPMGPMGPAIGIWAPWDPGPMQKNNDFE